MKTLLFVFCIYLPFISIAQNKAVKAASVEQQYIPDSVLIENIVEFYTYRDFQFVSHDAVRFKVKITNLGSQPIPNLTRVSNRVKYLKLLYNGEDSSDLNIGNGMEGGDFLWFIKAGDSDEFFTSWVLDKNAGIFLQEQPLNLTWEYMGVQSSTEIVDLYAKRVY